MGVHSAPRGGVRMVRVQTPGGHLSGPLPVLPPDRGLVPWRGLTAGAGRLAPLVPVAVLLRPVYAHAEHLQAYAGQVLGFGATLCLLCCLAVTPLSRVIRLRQAASWRRWLGLCMFILGAAGVAVAAAGGPRGQLGMRLSGHVQEWTGTVIVVALAPLALTSGRWAQKLLGGHWKTWQRRLTWAVWAMVAVHIAILAAWRTEAAFAMASGPLVAARVPQVRRDLAAWRASGYADSARWVLTGMAAGVFGCGLAVLTWLEVAACVTAFRLA